MQTIHDPRLASLRAEKLRHLDAAQALQAASKVRFLSADEEAEARRHITAAHELQARMKAIVDGGARDDAIASLSADFATDPGLPGRGGLYDELIAAGWNRVSHPQATVPFWSAFSFDGTYSDAVPRFVQTPPLGADQRFLAGVFPRIDVDADQTSISSFRQTGRTLPSPLSLMIRDVDAVSEKPSVDTATELATEPLHQIAAIEKGVPNVVLDSVSARSWIDADLRYAYSAGVDAHVIAQIEGANPTAATAGVDLLESILNGVEEVAANGYAPSVLAASPETLIDLTLLKQPGTADYIFSGNAPPLDGLRKVAVTGLATAYILDPNAAGTLYVSPVTVRAFEENAGQTNTSTVRIESHGVFFVQRVGAIAEVPIGS